MKISPFDKIICRTPAFGINQTLQEVWEELKVKIEESSPSFYQLIKDVSITNLDFLEEKTKFTIWKYFNRAKFRSTPFGSFAAITTVKSTFNPTAQIVLSKDMKPYHFIDWSHKKTEFSNVILAAKYLLSNSSIYFVAQEIRYIKSQNGSFELAAVNALPELSAILLLCKRKSNVDEVYELMKYSYDMNKESTMDLLTQMIDLQLLQTDLHPNITGEDYFIKLQTQCINKPSNYIIAERKLLEGSFDGKSLKQIPALLSFVSSHFSAPQNLDLKAFKEAFVSRFENQEISLAIVMDPEIGIGYGNLAQLNIDGSLINEIKQAKQNQLNEQISYGKLQQFLLKKIIANESIDLAEFKAEVHEPALIPNTISLMFHLYNGKPVIANAGGSTANALLGRFTLQNEVIENYTKEIAHLEMNVNKDIVFFDIAYQAEKKIDNVNRRKQIYPYELPILTWSDTQNPLDLNDILVTVVRNELILKSKKLGKRIIPRIPSAYNYTRSDLAVYRFLCDVQNQGLLTGLSFKLQDFFPKLNHYPRMCYEGIVLSPAMWLLPKNALNNDNTLENWLAKNKINGLIKVGYADQSLCFDPKTQEDRWALLKYGKQQNNEIYLTEALLSEIDYIKDEKGNSYSPQYIASYYHQNTIYLPHSPVPNQTNQFYLPGSEWLYFELYCHPSKSNYILLKVIDSFLKKHNKELRKWFFIRYTSPKPHIRLRLQLKNLNTGFSLISSFELAVAKEIEKGFIIDFKLATYTKEIQRYGADKIDLVEQFFYTDSRYVLQTIKNYVIENQLITKTVSSVQNLCSLCFFSLDEQLHFVKAMSKSFASEMNLDQQRFKKINIEFNQLKLNIVEDTLISPSSLMIKRQQLLKAILEKCKTKSIREKMLADLIHMHVNRVFITDQRIYETVIYHYLMKLLQTRLALSKDKQVFQ